MTWAASRPRRSAFFAATLVLAAAVPLVLTGCGSADGTEPFAPGVSSPDGRAAAPRPLLVDPVEVAGAATGLASDPADDPAGVPTSVAWNAAARSLVASHRTSPPFASRVYALVSVAQNDALAAAEHASGAGTPAPTAPGQFAPDTASVSRRAAVAGASAAVLSALYPDASLDLAAALEAQIGPRRGAGRALGEAVAARVLAHAARDGADRAVASILMPDAPGVWSGNNPLLPGWGQVRTWLVDDVVALRPAAPPAYGSPEFLAALAEVRAISDARTPEQERIAHFWADGAGTATPPGHWNEIACGLIERSGMGEARAARTLALLNMALMDAGVCCWDAKYAYNLLRPSMADPQITLPVGLPNFPAYTSGHSTFSGAAAEYLGSVFPSEAPNLRAMAEEASVSRVYGGIHYRFDCETGMEAGRRIGLLAAQRDRGE